MRAPLVLKVGGELLDTAQDRRRLARAAAAAAAAQPLVIVHGGGRAIDAELARRHITPRKVDGLRITDEQTLDAVIAVLAGSANTALVASLAAEGLSAVGLTGADGRIGRAVRAAAYQPASGGAVDLGLVGEVVDPDLSLLSVLLRAGHVPVIASLGLELTGHHGPSSPVSASVLNVNADVMACAIAAGMPGCELVIAGATPGVLDAAGRTLASLDAAEVDALIASGTATAGMIAKLAACCRALEAGVVRVRIVDGRQLDANATFDDAAGTTLTSAATAGVGAFRGVRRT